MSAAAHARRRALAALALSLLAASFFTHTYLLNRAIANDGGFWGWTASLRYLITMPMLVLLMPWQGGAGPVLRAVRAHPWAWLRCGAIGFVGFYLALSFAADRGPSWLIAGSFQFTVVAGMLCAPFIYRDARRRIPRAALAVGGVVLAGVLLMQFGHAHGRLGRDEWVLLACVLAAAVCYPLGNRLLLLHLERSGETLNASQRVFGMTLASQPLWLCVAAFAWQQSGAPPWPQVLLAGGVALDAGVIATILFFQATGMVRDNPAALGATEAMQGAEPLITTVLGVTFLHEAWPSGLSAGGAVLVMAGIAGFAWMVARGGSAKQADAAIGDARTLRTDRGA